MFLAGSLTLIDVPVQFETVAGAPPNLTEPAVPKSLPLIVTTVPTTPCLGDNEVMTAADTGGIVVGGTVVGGIVVGGTVVGGIVVGGIVVGGTVVGGIVVGGTVVGGIVVGGTVVGRIVVGGTVVGGIVVGGTVVGGIVVGGTVVGRIVVGGTVVGGIVVGGTVVGGIQRHLNEHEMAPLSELPQTQWIGALDPAFSGHMPGRLKVEA